MSTVREQLLSQFIDAWNAGAGDVVVDVGTRAAEPDRNELAGDLSAFLAFAPTPAYSEETLQQIRAEPIVAQALVAAERPSGVLPDLLQRLRARLGVSPSVLARAVVDQLGLEKPQERQEKTTAYLLRLESGELEPAGVSRRVFDALARVLSVPREQLEGAADIGGWGATPLMASGGAKFRADEDAAAVVTSHLDVLADALQAPGEKRDEIDDLFLGGR